MTNLLPARETIFDFKELFLPIWKPLILVTSKRVRNPNPYPSVSPLLGDSHYFYGAVVGATSGRATVPAPSRWRPSIDHSPMLGNRPSTHSVYKKQKVGDLLPVRPPSFLSYSPPPFLSPPLNSQKMN